MYIFYYMATIVCALWLAAERALFFIFIYLFIYLLNFAF